MIKINYWWFWIVIILLYYIIIQGRNKLYLEIIKRKRKGMKRKMPQELMKEFIGKVCTIILFNDSFGIQGRIVEIEDNWIKVVEKIKLELLMEI